MQHVFILLITTSKANQRTNSWKLIVKTKLLVVYLLNLLLLSFIFIIEKKANLKVKQKDDCYQYTPIQYCEMDET